MARDFIVSIHGLKNGLYSHEFQLAERFFQKYGQEVVANGELIAKVGLDKKETFIEADFNIEGKVFLVCDRSLDEFEFPMAISRKIVFKFGDEPKEVSDEITIIHHDLQALDVGQLMYEFIVLEIPIKRLHPRYLEENNDGEEGSIIYSSSADSDNEKAVDPRWEILKKLK